MQKLLLIVNAQAGKQEIKDAFYSIIDLFTSADYLTTVIITQYPQHATEAVERHGGEYDLIVCVGGDGTFNEAVNGLMKIPEDIPLGYIPSGTVNDLARSLEFSKNPLAAARSIIAGKSKNFDIGTLNKRYFTYVAAMGAFTSISHQTPQNLKNLLGRYAYYLEGVKSLPELGKSYNLRIKYDDQEIEGDYIFVSISNSYSLGGLMQLDPECVSFSDGEFELMLIRTPNNPVDIQRILYKLHNREYDDNLVMFIHAKHFEIESDQEMLWTIDGEEAGEFKSVEIEVCEKRLSLIY